MAEGRTELQEQLLQQLMSVDFDTRVKLIDDDVNSNSDVYKVLDPLDLANALQVPFDTIGESFEWEILKYSEIIWDMDECIMACQPWLVIDFLDRQIPDERYWFLRCLAYNSDDSSLLVKYMIEDEKCLIPRPAAESDLYREDMSKYIASYIVGNSDNSITYMFEADIEGDEIITVTGIRTPYDYRDGKHIDPITNDHKYVFEFV